MPSGKTHDPGRTVVFRLTLWLTAALASSSAVLFVICYYTLSAREWKKLDEEVVEHFDEIASAMDRKGVSGALEEIESEAKSEGLQQIYFELRAPDGRSLGASDASAWEGVEKVRGVWTTESGPAELYTSRLPGGGDRVRSMRGRIPSGHRLFVAFRLDDLDHLLGRVRLLFMVATGAITCLVAAIGWLLTRRAMGGVEKATQTARSIARGDLEARVPLTGSGAEIDRLAIAFNEMIERIQTVMAEMSEMTDNIAHDLRTPVSRIRIHGEALLDSLAGTDEREAAAGVVEECDRLLGIINTMLDISEAEAGIAANDRSEFDLAAIVRDVVELYQPSAEDKGISLASSVPLTFPFAGQADKMQRLVANLLDNGIKYTPWGGTVSISLVSRGSNPEIAEIKVEDTGIGIPSQDLPHIFERFYRGDASRSVPGTGLGLAYVQALARSWNGEVKVASQEGHGTTVSVTIPLAESPAFSPAPIIANR